MGILGDLLTNVAKLIDKISSVIPNFSGDTGHLSESIAYMNSLLSKADAIFPVSDVGKVLGLMLGIYIALLFFYFVQRAINLLRGAG